MESDIRLGNQARKDSTPIATKWRMAAIVFAGVAVSLCTGCASGPPNADPFEKTNRLIYKFNDVLDRVALKPAADVYEKVIPKPIRTGIGNGFDNLIYFNVVCNDFLQAKWGQGLGDFGRMAANSTIGIGGIFDVASHWGLPAHENDLGITLGRWGAGPGPYLVLPLLGPSTVRDAPGIAMKYAANPTTWLYLPIQISIPLYVVDIVDLRSRFDSVVRFRNAAAIDPYVFTRNAYLQYREAQIHEGEPATEQSFYDEDSDAAPAATRPTSGHGE
jgi:phospholipid-binding lipoprotein MlaA